MRRKRQARNADRHRREIATEPHEIVLPGLTDLQESEEQYTAWYDDPSYADRLIDLEASAEVAAYRKEGMCP